MSMITAPLDPEARAADDGASFSADWLSLREPADARARALPDPSRLAARLARALDGAAAPGETLRIVDLGSGTGANLRALAPLIGRDQVWVLLDHDAALLADIRGRLLADGGTAGENGITLQAPATPHRLTVRLEQADLASEPDVVRRHRPHLVTASAFFDLVSEPWIARFCDAVAAERALFFTALTCTGDDLWTPPHPDDAAVAAAFRADQTRDKGFGPAAGAQASACLARAFAARGYVVAHAASRWDLTDGDRALIEALADGTAAAAAGAALLPPERIDAWRLHRRQAVSCRIGHEDLLASPSALSD